MDDALDEIWRPVPSLPGVLASSWGRILLLTREVAMPNGGTRIYKTKPVWGCKRKSKKGSSYVYMGVNSALYGNIKIHRAVCEAFHGAAPSEGAIVIHRNEIGTNNREDNLKWGTQAENLAMEGFVSFCRSRKGEASARKISQARKKSKMLEAIANEQPC